MGLGLGLGLGVRVRVRAYLHRVEGEAARGGVEAGEVLGERRAVGVVADRERGRALQQRIHERLPPFLLREDTHGVREGSVCECSARSVGARCLLGGSHWWKQH